MSIEAVGKILRLAVSPSGERITRDEKLVGMVVADAHNIHHRLAWPSLSLIAELALMSERHARRQLRSLERKGVIRSSHPEKQGRGRTTEYEILILDSPAGKGDSGTPFWAAKGDGPVPLVGEQKGDRRGTGETQKGDRRGTEGGPVGYRNKEEPRTKNHKNQEPRNARVIEIPKAAEGSMQGRRASEAWEVVLGRLRERINRHSFESWLKPTRGVKWREQESAAGRIGQRVLTVEVPNAEHLHLAAKYGALLAEVVAELEMPCDRLELVVAA